MQPAWVDTRSVFAVHSAGPIICPDPTGRGVSRPSDMQSDKAEIAAAQLEVDGSEQNAARAYTKAATSRPECDAPCGLEHSQR